jgi:hypothetical protein
VADWPRISNKICYSKHGMMFELLLLVKERNIVMAWYLIQGEEPR